MKGLGILILVALALAFIGELYVFAATGDWFYVVWAAVFGFAWVGTFKSLRQLLYPEKEKQ